MKRGIGITAVLLTAVGAVACSGGGAGSSSASSSTGSSASSSAGTSAGSPANPSSEGQPVVLAANLHGATTAGVAAQVGTSTASIGSSTSYALALKILGINDAVAQQSANTVAANIALNDLVSIDASGNVARVFNQSFPVYSIKSTNDYLIVSGKFASPIDASTGKPVVVDAAGNALNCYLYAVRKTATGNVNDVTCLARQPVGSYDPTAANTNAHYAHLGFDTRGASVYFTDRAAGILYKWTEGTSAPTVVFQQTPVSNQVGMDDVFLDHAGANICVLYSALGLQGGVYYGDVYCGTDSGLTSTLHGDQSNSILAESRALGKYLLTGARKVDLTSLAISPNVANGSNYGLPSGNANIVVTPSGATIQRAYAWSLSYTDINGNTCLLATTNGLANTGCANLSLTINSYFQTVLGLGGYTWAYGTSDPNDATTGNFLARINNTSLALDGTNYLAAAGMTSIADMSIASDGRIVLTGKNGANSTVYAYIDSSGSLIPSSTPPTFKLSQALNL